MSLLDEFATALADIRSEMDVSASYYRGTIAFNLGPVSPGRKTFRFIGDDGGTQVVEAWEWLVDSTALTGGVIPRVGDVITQVSGTETHRYEVTAINGEPCFSYSDSGRSQMRIHTLYMGATTS